MQFEIKPFDEVYADQVKLLGEEFMDYLISLDPDQRLRRTPEYGKFSLDRKTRKVCPNTAFFIALVGNKVIGYVFGYVDPIPPPQAWYSMEPFTQGTGEELYVIEQYRGKGVGSMLIEKFLNFLKDRSCEYISVSVFAFNKDAVKLYEKYGLHQRGLMLSNKLNAQ